jgi:hypothetical protein
MGPWAMGPHSPAFATASDENETEKRSCTAAADPMNEHSNIFDKRRISKIKEKGLVLFSVKGNVVRSP